MNILYTTGRELSYPRNMMIHNLLKKKHRVRYIGRQTGEKSILAQSIINSFYCAPFLLSKEYELSVVGFYGHILMLWVGMLARQPILFDAFLSTYDTICLDRQIFKPQSMPGHLTKWIDRYASEKATRIMVDTQAHANFFHETFGVPLEKIDILYVGCDEEIFSPLPASNSNENTVLFYGSLLPLHGVNTILEASKLLKDKPVRFQLIGPFLELGDKYSNASKQNNLEFLSPIPIASLPQFIASAAVCLGGHFGSSAKAGRVIAGKTYQCMAMGKSTIVGKNAANQELFTHGYDAWFCKMDDPQALAESIWYLLNHQELRLMLGKNARKTFLEKASTPVLNKKLEEIVTKTISRSG
jgi:glycosyltransferase involved in cell wall biosynthesis